MSEEGTQGIFSVGRMPTCRVLPEGRGMVEATFQGLY